MNIEALYELFTKAGGRVCTDTRHIVPGSLFFGIQGEHFDGNSFAGQALEKGAAWAVVDDDSLAGKDRMIRVGDTVKALQDLARHHRRQLKRTKVIGLTGSNGKTTTKELLLAAMSKSYLAAATEGNLNNHLGVPLTLLGIKPECEYAIVEMGANHVREIKLLCEIAEPDCGLVTNVGQAHLEGFGGFEGVKRGKGELYDWLKSRGQTIFVNRDHADLLDMLGDYKQVVYYGHGADCLVSGQGATQGDFVSLQWRTGGKEFLVQTALTGLYNVENMLAAVCVATWFGVAPERVNAALEAYRPVNNRSQVMESGGNKFILDHYNANPTSMRAALENFRTADPGPAYPKRMLVLGDMLELDDSSPDAHQEIADLASATGADCLFVGKEFAACTLPSGSLSFQKAEEAAEWLRNEKITGYLVLVKGSRGVSLEKVKAVFELVS
jgi:UDP-N-acetylmuramoyl-tripeptide--D-alanyl-D-alanine ligase